MHQVALRDDEREGVPPPAQDQVQVTHPQPRRLRPVLLCEQRVEDRGRHARDGEEGVGRDPAAVRVPQEDGRGEEEVDGLEPPRHGAGGDAVVSGCGVCRFGDVCVGESGGGLICLVSGLYNDETDPSRASSLLLPPPRSISLYTSVPGELEPLQVGDGAQDVGEEAAQEHPPPLRGRHLAVGVKGWGFE